MGLFKKPWETKNEKRAQNWLEKTDDQDLLMKTVLNSPLDEIKIGAAKKIDRPDLLRELLNQFDMRIVRRALEKIGDKEFWLEFAKSIHRDGDKRLYALSLLAGDEAAVYDIAMNARFHLVRAKALEMLTDDDHIFEVLKKPGEIETPFLKAALKRIKDEKRRFEITVTTGNFQLREFGEQTLSDPGLLTELARTKCYFTVKNISILKNLKQEELYNCCMHAYDGEKIHRALDEITDPELLWKIAADTTWLTSSWGAGVVDYAVGRIADEKILNEYALRTHAGYEINMTSTAFEALLKRVRDQEVLLYIAKNTKVGSIFDIIEPKLTDPEKRYDVALNAKNAGLFRNVIGQSDDAMLLAYIICRKPVMSSFMGMSHDLEEYLKIAARDRLSALPNSHAALEYIKNSNNPTASALCKNMSDC